MIYSTIINYPGNLQNQFTEIITAIGYNQKIHIFTKGISILLLILLLFFHKKSGFVQILFLLSCSLTIFLFRFPDALLPEQNLDESVYITGARLLLEDPKIWFSFDPYTSGPLNFYVVSLANFLFGSIDYFTIRLCGLLLCTIPSVFCLYVSITFLYDRSVASLVSFGYTLFLAILTQPDFVAYGAESPTALLISLQLLCLAAIISGRSLRYAYCLCFFAGLTPYTKLLGVLISVLLTLILFAELRNKLTIKKVFFLVISGLVPSFVLVLYLYSNSLFYDFYKSYVLFNVQYGGSFGNVDSTLIFKIIVNSPDIIWFVSFIIFFVFFFAFYLLSKGSKIRGKIIYCLLILLLVWYSIIKTGYPFQHYLVILFFPLFWVFGVVLGEIIILNPAVYRVYRITLVTVFTFFVLITLTTKSNGIAYAHFDTYKPNELTEKIDSLANENDKMTIWGHGEMAKLYSQTSLLPGTRDVFTTRQIDPSNLQDYFIERFLKDFSANRPRIIVEDSRYRDYQARLSTVFSELDSYYDLRAKSGDYNIYLRKD